MSNVVLVVDMLKGFLEPGHNLYHEDSRRIIPNSLELIAKEKADGSDILFLADNHDPDDLEFQVFPVHCVIGTEETEVIPELSEYVSQRQPDSQEAVQRVLQHQSCRPPGHPCPGKAAGLRRCHQRLCDAHRVGRPEPRLRRRGVFRLRIRAGPGRPPLGLVPLPEGSGRQSNLGSLLLNGRKRAETRRPGQFAITGPSPYYRLAQHCVAATGRRDAISYLPLFPVGRNPENFRH